MQRTNLKQSFHYLVFVIICSLFFLGASFAQNPVLSTAPGVPDSTKKKAIIADPVKKVPDTLRKAPDLNPARKVPDTLRKPVVSNPTQKADKDINQKPDPVDPADAFPEKTPGR